MVIYGTPLTKPQIHFALGFLAKHAHDPNDGSHKKKNSVGMFLEQHLLGLVARLSEIINDPRDEHPIQEKVRCVKAFEELVKLAKSHARTARPQVIKNSNPFKEFWLNQIRYVRASSQLLTTKPSNHQPYLPGAQF